MTEISRRVDRPLSAAPSPSPNGAPGAGASSTQGHPHLEPDGQMAGRHQRRQPPCRASFVSAPPPQIRHSDELACGACALTHLVDMDNPDHIRQNVDYTDRQNRTRDSWSRRCAPIRNPRMQSASSAAMASPPQLRNISPQSAAPSTKRNPWRRASSTSEPFASFVREDDSFSGPSRPAGPRLHPPHPRRQYVTLTNYTVAQGY